MGRVTVNFADVQDFEAVPEDEYLALIESADWVEATEEGKFDYVNLRFDISEGEYKGRKVFTILSLSPKALFRMKQVFENLGIIDPEDELDLDYDEETMKLTSPELEGLPCKITVGTRTYEGREQNEVKAVTSADGAGVGEKKTTRAGTGRKTTGGKKTAATSRKKTTAAASGGRKFR